MNSNDRENLIGAGQAAAAYAIWRNSDTAGDAIMDNARIQGLVEGVHTRYAVTQSTGDRRLGRVAGGSAGARTYAMNLAVFAVPGALFLVPVILGMAAGLDLGAGFIFVWLPLCFALMLFMFRKLNHTYSRNHYERTVMPSTWELNRTGYWEVEQDVWFNPITSNVLYGHAYNGREAAQGRQSYRDESAQIRALYRQMKGQSGPSSTPARPAIQPAGKPKRGLRNANGGLWWS